MSHFKGPEVRNALPSFRSQTSVLELLEEALRKNGDEVEMVEGHSKKTITHKQLLHESSAIATGLRKTGVTSGDYVIVCCDKSIAAYSALLGVIFTGATAILYPIPLADSLHKLTKGFTIKAVFCDPPHLDSLKESLGQMTSPLLLATTDSQDEVFRALLNTRDHFRMYQVHDVAKHVPMIFFSSGTTGDPKGVLVRDSYVQMCGHYLSLPMQSFMVGSPMYWVSSLTSLMSSIFNKFTLIWSNFSDPKDNLRLIEEYQVQGWLTGTGTMTKYINEPARREFDLPSLKYVITGGEYLLSSMYEKFCSEVLTKGVKLLNGYGSTEGGVMALLLPSSGTDKFELGSCGPLFPGVEIKILDERFNEVPVGCLGEVYLRSGVLTPGYWGRPDLTTEAYDQDGFLRTGDAGVFDQRGVLALRGRVIDLVDFRGVKISPAEVEDILMSHPAVLEAAVVGKPHPTDIQHVTAYVVKKTGHEVSREELQEFVDGKVGDSSKLRGGVHFLDALPRTIIGKVRRKLLREL